MKKFSIVIAGGGSTYTPEIVVTLLNNRHRLPIKDIRLYDNDPVRQEPIAKACQILTREIDPSIEFIYTDDPQTAYSGVDFVLAHIRVGGLKMREQDEKIALKHGCVGQETCGPAGLAYGMRSIAGVLENVAYMEEYAPKAWMLNYSNPTSIVAEAVRRVYRDARIINICDMPIGLENEIASIISEEDRKKMTVTYYGLNHFGWYQTIKDRKGNDVTDDVITYMLENGYVSQQMKERTVPSDSWYQTFEKAKDTIAIDPTLIPNSYFKYYFYPDDEIAHSDPNYTRANAVMDGREKELFEMCDKIIAQNSTEGYTMVEGNHSTFIVDLAIALAFGTKERMILITENKGAIKDFPDDAMVEIPCIISKDGYKRIPIGEIPTFQKGLMWQQNSCEKLLVDAYAERSYHKLWQAFTLNRLVPNANVARELIDDYIEANKEYWPELTK